MSDWKGELRSCKFKVVMTSASGLSCTHCIVQVLYIVLYRYCDVTEIPEACDIIVCSSKFYGFFFYVYRRRKCSSEIDRSSRASGRGCLQAWKTELTGLVNGMDLGKASRLLIHSR